MAPEDKFGVSQLNPTKQGGLEWFNKWDNGQSRTLGDGKQDPFDGAFRFTNGTPNDTLLELKGDGTARIRSKIANSSIRMFVDNTKGWLNTEMTCYVKKIKNMSLPEFQLRSRSNHPMTGSSCDCNFGNYRVAWSSKEKDCSLAVEVMHPIYKRDIVKSTINSFPDEKYIGFKQVTRTVGGNKVKVEAWSNYDTATQNWTKNLEYTFDGNNVKITTSGTDEQCRKTCVDKGDKVANDLSKATLRLEAGQRCWLRMDWLTGVNLKYFSVREIDAL